MADQTPETRKQRLLRWADNQPVVLALVIVLALVGAVGPAYKTLSELFDPPATPSQSQFAQAVTTDLARIRSILPYDQSFLDCVARRPASQPAAPLEACLRERRSSLTDPLSIIDRHLATARLTLKGEPLASMEKPLQSLRQIIYEMQNNEMVVARWRAEGCSRGIKVVETLPPSVRTNPRCTLSVEDYARFRERAATNPDRVSTIRTETMHVSNVKVFIVEGLSQTIEDYFKGSNNLLMLDFEAQSADIRSKLRRYTQ